MTDQSQGDRDRAAFQKSVRERRAAKMKRPLRIRDLDTIAEGVGEAMGKLLAPILKRLDRLERYVEEIQKRGEVKHCGVWARGVVFVQGNMVTHKGGLWICRNLFTQERPGGSDHWQLVVKRGAFEDGSPRDDGRKPA